MTRREEIEQAAKQVGGVHPDWDALECFRVGYKEGAKWADKTMIEKAYKWILCNMPKYVKANRLDVFINNEDMANDFKRAMEIEQLHKQIICDKYDNIYGAQAPSNFELMEKINELVEEVNRLKEKFGEE